MQTTYVSLFFIFQDLGLDAVIRGKLITYHGPILDGAAGPFLNGSACRKYNALRRHLHRGTHLFCHCP